MGETRAGSEDKQPAGESVYRELESAYNAFALDIGSAWSTSQWRWYQSAQKQYQDAWAEASSPKAFLEAYDKYKGVIQRIASTANLDQLDPLAIAALSQGLCLIASYAGWVGATRAAQAAAGTAPTNP